MFNNVLFSVLVVHVPGQKPSSQHVLCSTAGHNDLELQTVKLSHGASAEITDKMPLHQKYSGSKQNGSNKADVTQERCSIVMLLFYYYVYSCHIIVIKNCFVVFGCTVTVK